MTMTYVILTSLVILTFFAFLTFFVILNEVKNLPIRFATPTARPDGRAEVHARIRAHDYI